MMLGGGSVSSTVMGLSISHLIGVTGEDGGAAAGFISVITLHYTSPVSPPAQCSRPWRGSIRGDRWRQKLLIDLPPRKEGNWETCDGAYVDTPPPPLRRHGWFLPSSCLHMWRTFLFVFVFDWLSDFKWPQVEIQDQYFLSILQIIFFYLLLSRISEWAARMTKYC